jgi:hypothetical protein
MKITIVKVYFTCCHSTLGDEKFEVFRLFLSNEHFRVFFCMAFGPHSPCKMMDTVCGHLKLIIILTLHRGRGDRPRGSVRGHTHHGLGRHGGGLGKKPKPKYKEENEIYAPTHSGHRPTDTKPSKEFVSLGQIETALSASVQSRLTRFGIVTERKKTYTTINTAKGYYYRDTRPQQRNRQAGLNEKTGLHFSEEPSSSLLCAND